MTEYILDDMTEEEEFGLGRRRRESYQGENGPSPDDLLEEDFDDEYNDSEQR